MKLSKETAKNIIKMLLFCAIVFFLGRRAMEIVSYKTDEGGGWQRYYQTERGKMDVVFFGSSHTHCTVDHKYLWENYGMAGYSLTAGSQKIDATLSFVKEVLRTQSPRVLVVEVWGATGGGLQNAETDVYRNALGMEWSENLWDLTTYYAENMGRDRDWRNRVFAKIPIVHSRYAELTKEDFQDPIPFMRGYRGSFDIDFHERSGVENITETQALDPERERMLQEIIDLTREKNVPLVLFAAPYDVSLEEQMWYNQIAKLAEENKVPFLNFNHLYEETGLDFSVDLRDGSHVNNAGAVKVTRYLGDFLKREYEIPDRRGEAGYELWEQNARYLQNKELRHELQSAENINEYLQKVWDLAGDRTVILALTGNYGALGEVYLDSLARMGISPEEYGAGGVWLYRDREPAARMEGKEYSRCFLTPFGEIHLESALYEEDGEEKERVKLLVNSEDYQMVENGVNLIVYDEELDMIIDAAGDDVYLGLEMVRGETSGE